MLSSVPGLRADGRNIVGQQIPTILDVTRCVRLHTLFMLVGVYAQSLKPINLLAHVLTAAKSPKCWGFWPASLSPSQGALLRGRADKKPPKLGDFKSTVHSYHLDSDREVEELNAAYIE